MRCSSYCTASEYKMNDLVMNLNKIGLEPKHYDDVLYVQKEVKKDLDPIDVFFFPFGCVTIWGADENQEKIILKDIDAFQVNQTHEVISDFIYFDYDEKAEKTCFKHAFPLSPFPL